MTAQHDRQASLQAMRAGFHEACAAADGVVEWSYQIGGFPVTVRFAGAGLVPHLAPALAHLRVETAGAPDLVINAWDSESTATPLPDGIGSLEEHYAASGPGGAGEDSVWIAYQRPNPGLAMLDERSSEGYYWIPRAGRTSIHDRSAPFRAILNWWMAPRGGQFVHAAAVGTVAHGAVLVVGKSGSGKSTTALTCLLDGMAYVGDDYNLLSMDNGPYVHSLFSTAKLHAHNIERLPRLGPLVENPGELEHEKGIFLLQEHFPDSIVSGLAVRAVLIPQLTGEPSTALRPASATRGLMGLAPSTLLQLSGGGEASLRMMGALVRAVPSYFLDLGTDVAATPGVIRGLLKELAA